MVQDDPTAQGKLPLHQYNSKVARKLADTAAISQDLGRTLAFVTRLIEEQDPLLQDALFIAALISYRRCFNTGTRLILDKSDLTGLREQADEIHDYYISTASKFAAHSVNPFEQMKVGVSVFNNEVVGAGVFTMRLLAFDKEGLAHWAHLISLIRNKLAKIAKELEVELLAEAKIRGADKIAKAPALRLTYTTDPNAIRSNENS